jgi:hypothetical protein
MFFKKSFSRKGCSALYFNKPASGNAMVLAQIIKEEIKREIMAELWAGQGPYFSAGPYPEGTAREGVGQLPNRGEGQPMGYYNPYVRKAEGIFLDEPDIAFYLGQGTAPEWINERAAERRKEILYGIGTVALLGMFLPPFGQKIQTILARATSEGMELIEKARSIAARAREDIEDLMAEANLEKLMKKPRQ